MGNFLESNWTHRDEITIYDIKKKNVTKNSRHKRTVLKGRVTGLPQKNT